MHNHNFENWPFECPEETGCLVTRQVMEQGFPILAILHDDSGTWQVLCETTENPDDGMIVCLGCLYAKFPLIGTHASLKPGFEAVRSSADSQWIIRKTEYKSE